MKNTKPQPMTRRTRSSAVQVEAVPQQPTSSQNAIKIIPLGGLHEIGKNTCVFEYDDEIVLLDAGLAFPTEEMHGVNIVLPDTTYLRENRHKIKGMIVTHGHEDHIGGIAYHLKQFDIPVIYGPRLAMALLQDKLDEAGVGDRTKLNTVMPRDMVRIGKNFLVEYIRNTHSIADSFTVAIHTPLGVIIHTGDFKVDYTPVDGEQFDFQRLAEHGEKGVLCLLSDSTNAEVPGHTPSEAAVKPHLDRIFGQAQGRLFVTTFASSVHRVSIILELAQKHRRKVAVVGRSMLNVISHARNLGYMKCLDELFIPLRQLKSMKDEDVLILTTGSQGESLSALTRISRDEHAHIKIKEGDTVVFSANPIPGNTIAVVNTIDRLMIRGAKVFYGKNEGIHVSGHGAQEDHKLMLALTKPKFFVPFHGEHRMLVKHAQTAQAMGVPAENIVVINNGDIVELTENSIRVAGNVPSGVELVDRSGVVHDSVLQERQQLASEGVITVAAAIAQDGKLIAPAEIHLRGIAMAANNKLIHQLIQRSVENILGDRLAEYQENGKRSGEEIDWTDIRIEIESALQRLARRELQGQPLVVFLMQVSEQTSVRTPRRRRRPTASIAS